MCVCLLAHFYVFVGFRWLVEAEGCRMYNFMLYPALHKLGPRLLIRFLQYIAHVESWCAVNAAVRRYSNPGAP